MQYIGLPKVLEKIGMMASIINKTLIRYEKTTSVYPFFEEPGGEGFIKKCFMLRQDLLNNLYRLYLIRIFMKKVHLINYKK